MQMNHGRAVQAGADPDNRLYIEEYMEETACLWIIRDVSKINTEMVIKIIHCRLPVAIF